MEAASFKVEGMTSAHCDRIKAGLGALTGVKDVQVSVEDKTVAISHDPKLISRKKLRETLEFKGYNVVS